MRKAMSIKILMAMAICVGISGVAGAAEVFVIADIAASETWTADNTYNLQDQIYVLPGATLTIDAKGMGVEKPNDDTRDPSRGKAPQK